jgi:hypothetical protein
MANKRVTSCGKRNTEEKRPVHRLTLGRLDYGRAHYARPETHSHIGGALRRIPAWGNPGRMRHIRLKMTFSKFIHAIVPDGGPAPGGMARIAPAQVLERIAPYLSRRKVQVVNGS